MTHWHKWKMVKTVVIWLLSKIRDKKNLFEKKFFFYGLPPFFHAPVFSCLNSYWVLSQEDEPKSCWKRFCFQVSICFFFLFVPSIWLLSTVQARKWEHKELHISMYFLEKMWLELSWVINGQWVITLVRVQCQIVF